MQGEAPPLNQEVWPKWATVRYEFPGTEHTAGPTLKLTWYHGERNMPDVSAPSALLEGVSLPSAGSHILCEAGGLNLQRAEVRRADRQKCRLVVVDACPLIWRAMGRPT